MTVTVKSGRISLVEGTLGNKDAEAGLKKFLTRLPVYSLVAFVTCFAVPETSWSQAVDAEPPSRPIESLKGKSPALPDLSGAVLPDGRLGAQASIR